MNERAGDLGLACTRFSSPDGFEDAGNHSCAIDLAEMARAVLDRPRLARIVARRRAVLPFPIKGGRIYLFNNNPLLRTGYPGTIGVKTGYTDAAGRCLVAAARRNGRRLGVVLLHSPDPGKQATQLLNRGFAARPLGRRGRPPARPGRAPCQPTRALRPASPSQPSRSGTVSGRSKPASSGVTTSAGSSGTMTSAITKRPPGASTAATRANRSALAGPSRWWMASAEKTRSNGPSGSGVAQVLQAQVGAGQVGRGEHVLAGVDAGQLRVRMAREHAPRGDAASRSPARAPAARRRPRSRAPARPAARS